MVKKEKLIIKLVGKPHDINEDIRVELDKIDRELFPTSPLAKKNESYWWLVYNSDGDIVAFAGLTFYTTNQTAFLARVGVRKSHRGQGLQKKLIKIRERFAKKMGYKRIISYTSNDNIHSANNLIRCGYLLYEPKWEWGIKYANYFVKHLE